MTLPNTTDSGTSDASDATVAARAEARGSLNPPPATPVHLTLLFLLLAAGVMVGTILNHKEPTYGMNDGSRWDTVYYLVEHGTYEFLPNHGAWRGDPNPSIARFVPPFGTIDMISIPDAQGRHHYYSSKPPFLPTIVAGIVLLIEKLSLGHADFKVHPWFFIRTALILVQVLPLLVAFWLIRRHTLRDGDSPFVHALTLAAMTFGTYLTAWTVTLNNHVIAAAIGIFAAHAMIRIWYDGRREWYWFAMAGFFGAFTAACELPAGLLAAAIMLLMMSKDWRRTLAAAVPGALVPTALAIGTNLIVTGRVMPAYTEVFRRGGWYDFPGSYWGHPTGIDALNEPKLTYTFNLLLGHHGFFSLTPVLLICLVAILYQLGRRQSDRRGLAGFTLLLSIAILTVYVFATKNYGGWCEGPRWLFWLIPLWLLFLADGLRILSRSRPTRFACYAALALSVLSMADALGRPWSWSWIQRLFQQFHWINYWYEFHLNPVRASPDPSPKR